MSTGKFRILGHGGRLVIFYFGGAVLVAPNVLAVNEHLPALLPPHGELPPSFWEQHGWTILALSVVALVALAFLIAVLRRPKPIVITPPDVIARSALEALRGRPEDGVLLVGVSAILRNYLVTVCELPPGELTTAELRAALESTPKLNPELVAAIGDFFVRCDERKFSPVPPAPKVGAVDAALSLVNTVHLHRENIAQLTPALPPVIVAAS